MPATVERAFVADINTLSLPDDSPVAGRGGHLRSHGDRDRARLHRGLPLLPGGDDLPPGARARSGADGRDAGRGVEKGGYDEASLTSLSTADYSCISPLVKKVMEQLAEKISLAVSSLRAYGLDEDLLDEIATVRATGLTFAPEAGTQRMRDVVNKNVTEETSSRPPSACSRAAGTG